MSGGSCDGVLDGRGEVAEAGRAALEREPEAAAAASARGAMQLRIVGLGEVDEPAVVAEVIGSSSGWRSRPRPRDDERRTCGPGSRSGRTCRAPRPGAPRRPPRRRRTRSSGRPAAARRLRRARTRVERARPSRSRRRRRRSASRPSRARILRDLAATASAMPRRVGCARRRAGRQRRRVDVRARPPRSMRDAARGRARRSRRRTQPASGATRQRASAPLRPHWRGARR